jgi:YD repeat-containing protein
LLTRTLTDTTTGTAPYSTGGQTRAWTYTWSNFLLASAQNRRTDVQELTKFAYDASGALTAVTNALGQVTKITQHLPGGLPQTVVDPNGVITNLTYDPRLRLLTRTVNTAAGPLTTKYSYDPAGNVLSVTLPDGSALSNSYDAAQRRFMIEQNTRACVQVISLTVVRDHPMAVKLGDSVGACAGKKASSRSVG